LFWQDYISILVYQRSLLLIKGTKKNIFF
jgi:hypothetical protein